VTGVGLRTVVLPVVVVTVVVEVVEIILDAPLMPDVPMTHAIPFQTVPLLHF
jgi:hypothetical protein